jgi:hypothetical protein
MPVTTGSLRVNTRHNCQHTIAAHVNLRHTQLIQRLFGRLSRVNYVLVTAALRETAVAIFYLLPLHVISTNSCYVPWQ